MSYAGLYAWHAHLLEIHSQALKHDVDIPGKLGAGQSVGGGGRPGLFDMSLKNLGFLGFFQKT